MTSDKEYGKDAVKIKELETKAEKGDLDCFYDDCSGNYSDPTLMCVGYIDDVCIPPNGSQLSDLHYGQHISE